MTPRSSQPIPLLTFGFGVAELPECSSWKGDRYIWLFLSGSFLAIVDKGDDTGQTLLVRARSEGNLERVFPFAEVVEGVGTDYKFRARVPREEVAACIADFVRSISHTNFKDTVHEQERHNAYMGVWQEIRSYQNNY